MTLEEAMVVSAGNKDAAGFICSFVNFCHLLDDCVDKDKPVNDVRLASESIAFIEDLLLNPFVQTNRIVLWPLIVVGFNSWLDANRWEREGTEVQKRDADVVKGIYHEVCWMTARLCGGWEFMRTLTSQKREYDHDYKEATK